jgi:hypothetical protein
LRVSQSAGVEPKINLAPLDSEPYFSVPDRNIRRGAFLPGEPLSRSRKLNT